MKRRRWLGGGVWGGLILGISAILSRAIPAAEQASPEDGKLRIIAFGAHPDDCEISPAARRACGPSRAIT